MAFAQRLGERWARQVLRGAMGLGSVPLPAQALIGLELVTVLIDIIVEADDLGVESLLGQPLAGRGGGGSVVSPMCCRIR